MSANGNQETCNHTLHMERRKHASLTGVTDVCSFHETEIVLKIDSGTVVLTGQELHIGKLLLDDGRLDVDGQIDSIVYEKPRVDTRKFWSWVKRDR